MADWVSGTSTFYTEGGGRSSLSERNWASHLPLLGRFLPQRGPTKMGFHFAPEKELEKKGGTLPPTSRRRLREGTWKIDVLLKRPVSSQVSRKNRFCFLLFVAGGGGGEEG